MAILNFLIKKYQAEISIGGTRVQTNNEKGITLVELLAVLVLVSLVTTIIITTFSIAHRHNVTETKKLKLQQEANYIISAVLQKHRDKKTDCYVLKVTEDKHKIIFKETDGLEIVLGDKFIYLLNHKHNIVDEVEKIEGETEEDLGEMKTCPKENDLGTTLIVKDRENPKLDVSVNTVFTRYKSKTLSKFDEEEENEIGN